MAKIKKPKCVMILTEGPSDRAALTDFFTDLYALIDEDIEVFFPLLREDSLSGDGSIETNYNGDITSRNGIEPDNILPMLLKMFIHPELKKHPAYEYPSSVYEVIHLVDIDGVFMDDEYIVEADPDDSREMPFYDDENDLIVVKSKENIFARNNRKRKNLQKLVETKRLRITMAKNENEAKEKPYKVFYFSSNLDHVLFGKANNESYNKVGDARAFGNDFFDQPLKLAKYFLEHPAAVGVDNYQESWRKVFDENESLKPKTNIDVLVRELLKKAKIKETSLPENDIR